MFKKLFSSPENQAYAAVDIGTESVKTAVFTVDRERGRVLVQGCGQEALRGGEQGGISDLSSIIAKAKLALKKASALAKLTPSAMVLGVAGEFIKGGTAVLSHEREEPEGKMSPAELRNIVHKLQWRAFGETRKAVSEETGVPEIDIKLVHTSLIGTAIDGYKVGNPLGFQGKELTLSIFNAFAPFSHFSAIHGIAAELNMELLGVFSEPYALSRALDFEGSSEKSCLVIDVGGGSTDVALIEDGGLKNTTSFAMGGRNFSKRLALELNVSSKEAEALKTAYGEDRLEAKSKKIIGDVLKNDVDLWLNGIVIALGSFKSKTPLPPRILLSGSGAKLPEVKNALNQEKWYKKLPFLSSPQAGFLTASQIRVTTDPKKNKMDQDPMPLALAAAALEFIAEENELWGMLKKVIGIMKV